MRKSKNRKAFKKIFLTLTIFGLLFLHFYVPRFITEINNPLVELINGQKVLTICPSFEKNQLKGKYINFKSFDGIALFSYLTYSNIDCVKGTIILLHGIRSNKECFIELSRKLSHLGYNSIALDRASKDKVNYLNVWKVGGNEYFEQVMTFIIKHTHL